MKIISFFETCIDFQNLKLYNNGVTSNIRGENVMKLGERLKVLRDRGNMTQEELAKKVQLSKANICKYEKNSVEPNIETIVKVCEIFNVTSDYLLGITDNAAPDEKTTDEKKITPFTEREQEILSIFKKLNEEKQNKVIGYASAQLDNNIVYLDIQTAAKSGKEYNPKPTTFDDEVALAEDLENKSE